jgi:hypothetical protein
VPKVTFRRYSTQFVPLILAVFIVAACSAGPPVTLGPSSDAPPLPEPAHPPSPSCQNPGRGPSSAPAGAVSVDPTVIGDLQVKTDADPPGTTFWLAPGVHKLGIGEYDQVRAKDGDTFLGAPGAILDGQGKNQYAFTTTASNVTVSYLTVRDFVPPQNEGVVNHDSGDGWVIEHNVIESNKGAGLMAGARNRIQYNCLRNNGQYGINAYQSGNGIVGLVVEYNEISGNNTDNWEVRSPGCGCSGGVKFWSVNGADIRSNWVHDNRGPGIWADTNNNDFILEGNLIESNDSSGLIYEASYNLVLRNNVFRGNGWPAGAEYAERHDQFPLATIYLSESGGEPRIPARTDRIEIYGNVLEDNWSGITAWENSDRFCNSPANTSSGTCTLLVPQVSQCTQPGIASEPLFSDCRWKTQRVDIHDNNFSSSSAAGCHLGYASRMAVVANFGTYPSWSPYKGDIVEQSISQEQNVSWHDNTYTGSWTFNAADVDDSLSAKQWQAGPYHQDLGSTFTPAQGRC